MSNSSYKPSSDQIGEDCAKQIEETFELLETYEKSLEKKERSLKFYEESLAHRERELSQRETEIVLREKEWDLSRLGTKVRRFFPQSKTWIDGMVVKWYPYEDSTGDEALWHICHTDLDEEDLNEEELLRGIDDYRKFYTKS
jgi:hypothetical protein